MHQNVVISGIAVAEIQLLIGALLANGVYLLGRPRVERVSKDLNDVVLLEVLQIVRTARTVKFKN